MEILSGQFFDGLNSKAHSNFLPENIVPLGVKHLRYPFKELSLFQTKSYVKAVGFNI